MKRLFLLWGAVVSGCIVNHAELDRQQAVLDVEYAMAKEKADNLIELRRGADAIEQQVKDGVQEFPALAEEWKAVQAIPEAVVTPRPPLVLPKRSLFEGSAGATKRDRLTDTDARLRMLEKLVAELRYVELRKERAARMLESIEKARAARTK